MKPVIALLAAAVLLLPAGCKRAERPASSSGEARSSIRRFPFKGVIRQVDSSRAQIVVEHEAVSGFMPAMTMPFTVHDDPPVIALLRPGDRIEATLVVGKDDAWLEKILTKGFVPTPSSSAAGPVAAGSVTPRPNRAVSPGDPVPDFDLTDQNGKTVRLSQLRGEPVAITFIYTRCPIASACPMATAKFSKLDAMLQDKKFGQLLSITVDPSFDTPQVLADYAKMMGAHPKRWRFLTGPPEAVARAAESFGVMYFPDSGQLTHTHAAAVVDSKGRLATIYFTDAWQPEHLLRDMEKARQS